MTAPELVARIRDAIWKVEAYKKTDALRELANEVDPDLWGTHVSDLAPTRSQLRDLVQNLDDHGHRRLLGILVQRNPTQPEFQRLVEELTAEARSPLASVPPTNQSATPGALSSRAAQGERARGVGAMTTREQVRRICDAILSVRSYGSLEALQDLAAEVDPQVWARDVTHPATLLSATTDVVANLDDAALRRLLKNLAERHPAIPVFQQLLEDFDAKASAAPVAAPVPPGEPMVVPQLPPDPDGPLELSATQLADLDGRFRSGLGDTAFEQAIEAATGIEAAVVVAPLKKTFGLTYSDALKGLSAIGRLRPFLRYAFVIHRKVEGLRAAIEAIDPASARMRDVSSELESAKRLIGAETAAGGLALPPALIDRLRHSTATLALYKGLHGALHPSVINPAPLEIAAGGDPADHREFLGLANIIHTQAVKVLESFLSDGGASEAADEERLNLDELEEKAKELDEALKGGSPRAINQALSDLRTRFKEKLKRLNQKILVAAKALGMDTLATELDRLNRGADPPRTGLASAALSLRNLQWAFMEKAYIHNDWQMATGDDGLQRLDGSLRDREEGLQLEEFAKYWFKVHPRIMLLTRGSEQEAWFGRITVAVKLINSSLQLWVVEKQAIAEDRLATFEEQFGQYRRAVAYEFVNVDERLLTTFSLAAPWVAQLPRPN